jgi:hypothetical protein
VQFINAYDLDYTMPKHYDLIIDVEDFQDADELAQYIINKLLEDL